MNIKKPNKSVNDILETLGTLSARIDRLENQIKEIKGDRYDIVYEYRNWDRESKIDDFYILRNANESIMLQLYFLLKIPTEKWEYDEKMKFAIWGEFFVKTGEKLELDDGETSLEEQGFESLLEHDSFWSRKCE